jgi:exosome complex RNA-binding protein Rrp42 (RNase PH superfamily)
MFLAVVAINTINLSVLCTFNCWVIFVDEVTLDELDGEA